MTQTPIPRERETKLVKALAELGGRATIGDVVRLTGLPRAQTEEDLRVLLGLYHSHLAVDEEGELLYLFEEGMKRRVDPGLGDMLYKLWGWTRTAMVLGLKIAIMGLLIFYVVAFCVLIIAAMIALASAGGDSDIDLDVGGGDGLIGGLASGLGDMVFFWSPIDVLYVPMIFDDFSHDRNYRNANVPSAFREPRALEARYVTDRYQQQRGRKKRFHEKVFSLIFGPQIPDPPALPEEPELLAWIHRHKGVITITELITRTGLSVDEAEKEMARLMSRYEGGVEVTDDGQLLYTFHGLRVTAHSKGKLKAEAKPAPPAWHRFEPSAQLTGNGFGTNFGIGAMAAFTMVMSVLSPGFLEVLEVSVGWGGLAVVTVLPLLLSLMFFAGPILRIFGVYRENSRRHDRNLRRALVLAIFEHLSTMNTSVSHAELLEEGARHLQGLEEGRDDDRRMKSLRKVQAKQLAGTLDKVLAEMGADIDTDPSGALTVSFPQQRAELMAADRARGLVQASIPLAEIAYSSAEEDTQDDLADQIDALEEEVVSQVEDVVTHKN